MHKLTNTSTQKAVFLDRPGQAVYITFPTAEQSSVTTFRIPPGSKWTPNPHWHEQYTEKFRVLEGRVRFLLGGDAQTVTKADGEQTVPKFAVHEFMRADIDAPDGEQDDCDVVVEEWVDPADGFKEVFFRTLSGIIGDSKLFGGYMPLQIICTMNYCDNYEVWAPKQFLWLARPVTYIVYNVATVAARLLGLKPVYQEYIPERLYGIASISHIKQF